ncbi:MAG TPA: PepSY-associated TM helix domain-containing protein [Caulobacteraceae bacterium]|jgi:hypothetical protein|nr:PepSY-associated TM helix domain-containing protein [Caulobacteraceae bacterium]
MRIPVAVERRKPLGPASGRGGFYRLCRMLHAYLSAFAFLALIFFCVTGVLLNHPEWFEAYHPAERTAAVTLTPAELAAAKAAKDPGRALAAAVAARVPLKGAFSSSDIQDGMALIRLTGPKGSSDIDLDLATGRGEAKIVTADLTSVIQDLHRGKNSGAPWRWVIDISAYLLLALSLIGYVLFFTLRFRLKTSLILTGVSLALLVGAAVWLAP